MGKKWRQHGARCSQQAAVDGGGAGGDLVPVVALTKHDTQGLALRGGHLRGEGALDLSLQIPGIAGGETTLGIQADLPVGRDVGDHPGKIAGQA